MTGERHGSDASTDKVCLQFKLRKALPKWLWEWLEGIVGTAQKAGKVGALVIKIPRMQDEEALVILRWADFVTLHGAPPCCRPQDLYWRNSTDAVCKRCAAGWVSKRQVDAAGSVDSELVRAA